MGGWPCFRREAGDLEEMDQSEGEGRCEQGMEHLSEELGIQARLFLGRDAEGSQPLHLRHVLLDGSSSGDKGSTAKKISIR